MQFSPCAGDMKIKKKIASPSQAQNHSSSPSLTQIHQFLVYSFSCKIFSLQYTCMYARSIGNMYMCMHVTGACR